MSRDDDSIIGKLKEKVGWLTADRQVEARGRLERLDADEPGESPAEPDDGSERRTQGSEEPAADESAADATLDQAERDVRRDYGEHDPEV